MNTSMTADEFSKLLNSVLSEGGSDPVPEPLAKFNDDPVALACASYRYYLKNSADRWRNFDLVEVIEEDRIKAEEIRRYYSQRLTFDALTRPVVSTFRTKLGAFLAGNHEITVSEQGLLYKLPYFYAEDIALDWITEQTVSAAPVRDTALRSMTLIPLKKILKARRGQEMYQYWFKSAEGYGCVLPVMSNNPLKSIVESLIYRDQIEISAYVHAKQHWNHKQHRYYLIGNVSLT
jgi:hypothetical protein